MSKWYKQQSAYWPGITFVSQLPDDWKLSPAKYPFPLIELTEEEAQKCISGARPECLLISGSCYPLYALKELSSV